jgi:hypothetical protein
LEMDGVYDKPPPPHGAWRLATRERRNELERTEKNKVIYLYCVSMAVVGKYALELSGVGKEELPNFMVK